MNLDLELRPALVYKIMCGRKLTALREKAGITQKQVARLDGWSQGKVSHVENATSAANPDELPPLLDLYRATPADREECHRLAMLSHEQVQHLPRAKTLLRNRFDGKMRDVIDLEASADTVWCHNSMLIPGLLQTEDYMRNQFRAYRPSPTRDQIDRFTEMRLERQAVLDNSGQKFWFVIHEAALLSLQGIDGGNAVLEGQARHLMEVLDRPNIEVQVAPFRNGFYPGQQENYRIFGFDTDPPVQVTYVEKYDGGDILHDERMTRFRTFWEHQRVHSLGPEQTRPFLRELSRPS